MKCRSRTDQKHCHSTSFHRQLQATLSRRRQSIDPCDGNLYAGTASQLFKRPQRLRSVALRQLRISAAAAFTETIASDPVHPRPDQQQPGSRNPCVTDCGWIEAATTIHDGKGTRPFQESCRTPERYRRCPIARTIADPFNQRTRRQSGVRQKGVERRQPGGDHHAARAMRLRLNQLTPKYLQRSRCSRHGAIRLVLCAATTASHKTRTVSKDLSPFKSTQLQIAPKQKDDSVADLKVWKIFEKNR
jgi:hypothetical protein